MSAQTSWRGHAAVILIVLTVINFLNYIDQMLLSSVLEQIKLEFTLSDTEGGLLGSLFVVTYTLAAPLGYLGDAAKTARTFPVVDGVRYAVPGDRASIAADGTLHLYGRDSVTINSGGEKIFAEEVEQALKHHPAVYDAVVVGTPSERWGQQVTALVRLRDGARPSEDELRAVAAEHVAAYKLPKAFVFVDELVRAPSGKADYRWAQQHAGDVLGKVAKLRRG